jgi:hypothetical protein
MSCGQSPRGLSRAWRSTPDDPPRFPHWRPCPRGRNPAPHPRSTSLPPGLPRAHADQPRSRSHRGTLIETCQRQDVQIEKESARLARFKREHLRGSNPPPATGDSSPSSSPNWRNSLIRLPDRPDRPARQRARHPQAAPAPPGRTPPSPAPGCSSTPRASRAFQRQGLSVIPLAAKPPLAAAARIPRGVPLFSGDSHTTAGVPTGEQMYYSGCPVDAWPWRRSTPLLNLRQTWQQVLLPVAAASIPAAGLISRAGSSRWPAS